MTYISHYLDPQLVIFSDETERDKVLQQLVDILAHQGKLKAPPFFYQAILEREHIVSTAIGMGVAIPHAKLPHYDEFFIAIAILSPGIDWNAMDDIPVRLVFMIGGPDDKQTEYLQILSSLTQVLKEEDRRKKILTANSAKVIIDLFDGL